MRSSHFSPTGPVLQWAASPVESWSVREPSVTRQRLHLTIVVEPWVEDSPTLSEVVVPPVEQELGCTLSTQWPALHPWALLSELSVIIKVILNALSMEGNSSVRLKA